MTVLLCFRMGTGWGGAMIPTPAVYKTFNAHEEGCLFYFYRKPNL